MRSLPSMIVPAWICAKESGTSHLSTTLSIWLGPSVGWSPERRMCTFAKLLIAHCASDMAPVCGTVLSGISFRFETGPLLAGSLTPFLKQRRHAVKRKKLADPLPSLTKVILHEIWRWQQRPLPVRQAMQRRFGAPSWTKMPSSLPSRRTLMLPKRLCSRFVRLLRKLLTALTKVSRGLYSESTVRSTVLITLTSIAEVNDTTSKSLVLLAHLKPERSRLTSSIG